MLKRVDTFVINAKTSKTLTLFVTSLELTLTPISTGIACGLTMNKKGFIKENYEKIKKIIFYYAQQTINSFDQL